MKQQEHHFAKKERKETTRTSELQELKHMEDNVYTNLGISNFCRSVTLCIDLPII
jgi:hypothetical protein